VQGVLWHDCLVCGDTISNHICYRCMQDEVENWLGNRNPLYISSVRRAGEFFTSYYREGAYCVMCGEDLNVCGKCYCFAVHKSIRKNRILASEFLDFAASKGFMLSPIKGVLNLQG